MAPAARRAQLLEEAVRVFARRGLAGARHPDLARAAGVSTPACYVYFPTRRALVRTVLGAVSRFYLQQAERIHARHDLPAPDVILAHGLAFAESVVTHPEYAKIWLEWSVSFDQETWPAYVRFQNRVVEILARTLRRGQREGSIDRRPGVLDEARLAFASAHMVAHLTFTGASPARVARFARAIVRAITGAPLSETGGAGRLAVSSPRWRRSSRIAPAHRRGCGSARASGS